MTIEELIDKSSKEHGVKRSILAGIIHAESRGNVNTPDSPKGAQGVAQIMPETAGYLGIDPKNPEQAIDGAAKYLRELTDRFGDDRLAVAAYNAGPGAVTRYGGVPPFPETQKYLNSVFGGGYVGGTGKPMEYVLEVKGEQFRINAPDNASDDELKALARTEYARRNLEKKEGTRAVKGAQQQGRTAVKEVPSPVTATKNYATNVFKGIPGAIGRALNPKNVISGPTGTGFGGGDVVTPESLERGMSLESIPILGSVLRASRGAMKPEEAADWVVSLGQAGLGSRIPAAARAYPEAAIPSATRGAFSEPGYSKPGAAVGSAAGGAAGAGAAHGLGLPYYVGAGPGMAMGGLAGSKVPAMIRGFKQGLQNFSVPERNAGPINAEPAPSGGPYNPWGGMAQGRPALNVPSVDIRGQKGPFYGGQPATEMPPAQGLPPGPGISGEYQPPQPTGPAIPQGTGAIPMPPAGEVPVYGGKKGLARASESGMYTPRQRRLQLYQEGANIPPPPEEAGANPFNVKRENLKDLGKPYEPPLQMSKKGAPSAEELKKVADTLNMSVDDLLKEYPHLKEGGEAPEYEYRGKGKITVEEKTPKKEQKVILPEAVRAEAKARGESLKAAVQRLKKEGFIVKADREIKKLEKD